MPSAAIDGETPIAARAVRAWRFPTADAASQSQPASIPDTAEFLKRLALTLRAATSSTWVLTLGEDAGAVASTRTFVRADGMIVAVALPETLAAAVVGRRCGGGFEADDADVSAPSVARARSDLHDAVLAAADGAWPGGSSRWSPGVPDDRLPRFLIAAEAGDYVFQLSVAVCCAPDPVASSPASDAAIWARRLRGALDATPFAVRAVLHERSMTVTEAVGLRVGDVLPIETRRDISLRLGDPTLARGTVTPGDGGEHHVTIGGARPSAAALEETI